MQFLLSVQLKVICITFCLLLPAFSSLARHELRISSANYPPFVYSEHIPSYGCGLGCDIVTQAFRAVSLTAGVYMVPMTRNVWSLTENKSSANLGVLRWYQAEGLSSQVDSVDILTMNFVLFYKKSRFPKGITFTRISDLLPYTISTVRGSFMTQIYQDAGLNMSYSTRVEQNLLKLEAGRVDLAIAVDLSGWQIISDLYPDKIHNFATVDKPVMTEPLALIFRKEDYVLKTTFRQGLRKIVLNGEYQSILERYYQRAGLDPALISGNIPVSLQNLEASPETTEGLKTSGSLPEF